jgi:hypothetical protein
MGKKKKSTPEMKPEIQEIRKENEFHYEIISKFSLKRLHPLRVYFNVEDIKRLNLNIDDFIILDEKTLGIVWISTVECGCVQISENTLKNLEPKDLISIKKTDLNVSTQNKITFQVLEDFEGSDQDFIIYFKQVLSIFYLTFSRL